MNALRSWFDTLAQRERIMVAIGACAVALALFYYAVWQPINTSLVHGRAQVSTEAKQTRWLLGLRAQARQLRAQNDQSRIKGQAQSILAIIDSTSRSSGLADAVQRIQPDSNDEAVVTLDDAAFDTLLYWLHTLRRDYAIRVAALTVTRDSDNGRVQARLKLERGDA